MACLLLFVEDREIAAGCIKISNQPIPDLQRRRITSKTVEDLKEAFAGNSRPIGSICRAKKADQEGFPMAARLFGPPGGGNRACARGSEVLAGIRSTKENIKEAIEGESHEFQKIYPKMIEDAKTEGNSRAFRSFEFANAVEKIHAQLYQKMFEIWTSRPWSMCTFARSGTTVEGEPPEKCPVCGALKKFFERID